MKALYLLLILVGLFLAYRVYVAISTSKRKTSKSTSKDPLLNAFKVMEDIMNDQVLIDGKVPGGYGSFGYTSTNPIPVKGMMGAKYYLSRLITDNGDKLEYCRLGQAAARNIENPIDIYEIKVEGEFVCKLFLCSYYKEMSNLAPKGFKIVS